MGGEWASDDGEVNTRLPRALWREIQAQAKADAGMPAAVKHRQVVRAGLDALASEKEKPTDD